METERRDLPAQVGDLAPRDALEPTGDQRVLDLGKLAVELVGRLVVPGARARPAGEHRSRAPEPLGDEPEALSIRLVGEAPPELSVGLRQVLGVAREAGGKRPRHPVVRGRRRHGLHQPERDRLVAVEDVVGVDAQRPLGHLRGDRRVAVPVTADPRPEADEGRDARRPRARVRIEGGIDRPVQAGHQREQRRVEHGHRRADLVERFGRHRAEVRGAPQQRDLLAQAAADLVVLRGGQPRVVEPFEEHGAAAQGDERRAAARLGRVRREDRRHAQPSRGARRDRRRRGRVGAAGRSPRRPNRRAARPARPARAGGASGPAPGPRRG